MKRIATDEVQDFEIEHQNIVRKYAPESMVLLKNDNILPLNHPGKIALYGNGARNTIKGGTGSGDVNVRHFVTVEEGLEQDGFEITTKRWLYQYSELKANYVKKFKEELVAKAKAEGKDVWVATMGVTPLEPDYDLDLSSSSQAEAAVYVLARDSGEGADRHAERGDIKLTKTEVHDILSLAKQYKKFVLVLNVGGLVDLSEVKDQVPAILLMSQLGSATGNALADVLLGKSYPSGKLAMTWAPIEQYPSTDNFGDINDTYYKEGIYVGYRYFDSMNITPLYEFGYGLSYTSFKLKTESVKANAKKVELKVRVSNIGNAAGKEVVQVYYSAPDSVMDQPYQKLAAYAKTKELAPGEEQVLTLTFNTSAMASYNQEKAESVLGHGDYLIRVGNSSRNTKVVAKVNLNQNTVIEKFKHIGGKTNFKDFIPNKKPISYSGEKEEIESAPVFSLHNKDFELKENHYPKPTFNAKDNDKQIDWSAVVNGDETVEDFVASLDNETIVYLLTGNYEKGKSLFMVGNAGATVAGSAGETTHQLTRWGVPSLVMADGPAGIRLSTSYTLDEKGKAHALVSEFGDSAGVPREDYRQENTTTYYYQYCTAIPIGTAIAQSWNPEVAEEYGDLVGNEMQLFGIDIWLAPALNIQRSPLDGRDFEYYSEDPLISGLNAAGITNGIRKHPGCTTTIKHFAANNQETNRVYSNSVINERTLRQIYLKGFEICLENSEPLAVMSSYNLLNGIHTCNRYDLLTDALRNEWHFNGFVMTDWLVTSSFIPNEGKYSCASAAQDVATGNDMTMPGLEEDTETILKALRSGELTREDLEIAASRILKVILKLKMEKEVK